MPRTTRAQIDAFLAHRRLAVVGVSRQPRDFTRAVFSEFRRRNYDAIPVNPGISEVDGLRCYASVRDIAPPVDAALLMTPPAVTAEVVKECADAGIRSIWMYRANGLGAVSPAAVRYCEDSGISLVPGECPFMFFPETTWFHRLHGLIRKLFGRYPH